MTLELKKRIITSIFLLSFLVLMFFYTYILIIGVIIISVISWVEFYNLISRIFLKKNFTEKMLQFFYKFLSLLYLSFLIFLIFFVEVNNSELKIFIIYSILVSILSYLGGLTI